MSTYNVLRSDGAIIEVDADEFDADRVVEPSTDPADYPLLPWQFKVMVDVLDVDAAIRAAIDNIEDVWQRAVAMRRYTDATSYEWSDPLLQQIRAAIGMSEQDLASHWMVAKDLRSTG